jgi:hypothetical protein
MKQSTVTALQARAVSQQPVPPTLFPRWENLPPVYQREMVMALTTMLTKRIAVCHSTQGKRDDE